MTNEERRCKMQEIRDGLETKVQEYNAAFQEKKFDEASRLDGEIAESVDEYTGLARVLCFEECKQTGDPMMAAVKKLSFKTIGTHDGKEGEGKIPVRRVIDKEQQIDILKLHNYCQGIGADHTWPYMVEKFNLLLTAQKAVELGIDPKTVNDSYAMSENARKISMGQTPTSNTQVLKQLRMVISAMIGEEFANKATSHDVNFLKSVYSRKSRKALTVACANNKYLRGYLLEIAHQIVTERGYNLDFKKVK